jgi:tetratricopeptide (TPR) repeat protein
VATAVLAGLLAAAAGLLPQAAAAQDVAAAMTALEARDYAGAARAFADAADASDDPSVAERATQYTFATGFDGYALRAASRWVELAPENPLAREVLGRLNLRRHDVDAAARELSFALGAAEPRRDEVYLALAADLATEDDAALVTRVLARLAGEDPLAPGLQLALGNAALRSRDWELAAAAAAAASIDDPDWEEPQLLAARAQAGAGDIEPALARIAALEGDEDRAGLALDRVRILEEAGQLDAARAVVEELATRFGERPPVVRARAFLDMRADRLDDAARGFDTLARADQDRFEAFYYLGQIARDQGDAERGRRSLARITNGPYLVPARLAIAESLAREGKLDEALESLRRFAADYPPRAFDVLDAEAQLLASADRLDEALAVYDRGLVYKPESPAVLLARGALLDRLGRVDEALRDLARAAAIAPGDAVVENAYGYTLAYRTRRTGEAYARIRRAIEQAPGSPAIQDSMGYVLYRQGRIAEARSWLEQAFAGLPDPEVAAHLAEVWQAAGEKQRARDLALAALVAYPDSEPARRVAERLLR